jgi:hypothetical protein
MIGLLYKGQPVLLYPDTTIDFEVEDDFLDFDNIGRAYSWPISLPREGNEWIFRHAGDADTQDNLFKTWDGFQITVDGNVWWDVSLDLDDADQTSYSGMLTNVNEKFFSAKDKKLRDLITGEVVLPAGDYISVIRSINELEVSDIRFPWIHFYGTRVMKPDDDYSNQSVNVSASTVISPSAVSEILNLSVSNSTNYKVYLTLDGSSITDDDVIYVKVNGVTKEVMNPDNVPSPQTLQLDTLDLNAGDTISVDYFNTNEGAGDVTITTSSELTLQSNDRKPYQILNSSDLALLPTFRAKYILDLCMRSIGMKMNDSATDYDQGYDPLDQLLLIHNRFKAYDIASGATIAISDHVPDMTLNELIKDLALYNCSSAYIESNNETITFRSMARDLSTDFIRTELIDYDPNVRIQASDYVNLELSWNLDADERVASQTVEKLEGRYRGEFDTYSDWTLSLKSVGDYGYVKSLGQYHRLVEIDGSSVHVFYSYPFQSYKSGDKRLLSLQPKLLPVVKDTHFYHRVTGSFEIKQAGSIIKLLVFGALTDFPDDGDQVMFIEDGSEPVYATERFVTISSVDAVNKEIILPILYSEDSQASEIIIRKNANGCIPIIGDQPHWPEGEQDAEGFGGRIAMWHGMKPTADGADTYPMATADSYDHSGASISKYNLSWTGPQPNLVSTRWLKVIQFIRQARYLTIRSYEPIERVLELYKRKKARLTSGSMRFKRFRATLSQRGIRDQEIEGWRV